MNYNALTPLLKQAQKLGALDASEGARAKKLPQILDTLRSTVVLDQVGRGMVVSMYQAGYTTTDRIKD